MMLTSNQKLLLNLLSIPEGGFKGNFRVQATVYFLESELSLKNKTPNFTYSFVRGKFSPYSSQLNQDLKKLEDNKLIEISWEVKSFQEAEKVYVLTSLGREKLEFVPPEVQGLMIFQVQQMHEFFKEDLLKLLYGLCRIKEYELEDAVPLLSKPAPIDRKKFKNKVSQELEYLINQCSEFLKLFPALKISNENFSFLMLGAAELCKEISEDLTTLSQPDLEMVKAFKQVTQHLPQVLKNEVLMKDLADFQQVLIQFNEIWQKTYQTA